MFAVADTFSLHCFFLQSLIAVFLFLIDHACFKKSGMSIQKLNFFLQKNSLSVYVEQGKNVLVFNKLFLILSFERNRLTTVIANRIAVAASFIVLSSEEVVCGSKVITIEGSVYSLTFSSFVKSAVCS